MTDRHDRPSLTAVATVAASIALAASPGAANELIAFTVVNGAIPAPLTDTKGDAAIGRAIVANRQVGLCLLCHSGPIPEERFQGDLAPDLTGTAARWSEGELRARMIDARLANPATIMPPYYVVDGLDRVAANFRGKPLLTAAQIEDVVAYLVTLK
jgi:L-cysteine S-thiosulfotransferase